jgi:tetratricopeptide (TPR) repeat protein
MKIPLIFWCPGIIPEGKVLNGTFRHIDLMPTLLEIFGIDPHQGAQGVSHMDQIFKGEEELELETYLESHYAKLFLGWSELRGVQWGEWKYVEAPKPELYNLKDDPNELVNLYEERPGIVSSMQERLDSIVSAYSGMGEGLGVTIPMDEEHREALESLGYLTQTVHIDESTDSILPDPKDMMPEYTKNQITFGKIILAGTLIEGGIYDDAIKILEEADNAGDKQWLIHYNLGIAYMEKGKDDHAKEELQKAIELTPIGPERVQVREALRYVGKRIQKGARK